MRPESEALMLSENDRQTLSQSQHLDRKQKTNDRFALDSRRTYQWRTLAMGWVLMSVLFSLGVFWLYASHTGYESSNFSVRDSSSSSFQGENRVGQRSESELGNRRRDGPSLSERLVHFDLKGAPPRLSYLLELIPLLRHWGATGLLIEWEDMFPYRDRLAILSRQESYSSNDVKTLLNAARSSGLRVIPLVQTLGHVEFVLKHEEFQHLREVADDVRVICPSKNESLQLVQEMIDQVMDVHREYVDAIHIGADEAHNIATSCHSCRNSVRELGSKDHLLLNYVSSLARSIKNTHNVSVLMWNDMFERTPSESMKLYEMDRLVEPVIWGYATDLFRQGYFADGVFDRFGETFQRLWVASAFKGANGISETFVDISRYALNHASWIAMLKHKQHKLNGVYGIILTGWQRYFHYAPLCELLPTAIPSLVYNLQMVQQPLSVGSLELYSRTRAILGCRLHENWIKLAPEWSRLIERYRHVNGSSRLPEPPALKTLDCQFPGVLLHNLVERLRLIRFAYDDFAKTIWFNDQMEGTTQPIENPIAEQRCQDMIKHFHFISNQLRTKMNEIYFEHTVDEWMSANVDSYLKNLRKLDCNESYATSTATDTKANDFLWIQAFVAIVTSQIYIFGATLPRAASQAIKKFKL